jgi:hypothetical protein
VLQPDVSDEKFPSCGATRKKDTVHFCFSNLPITNLKPRFQPALKMRLLRNWSIFTVLPRSMGRLQP